MIDTANYPKMWVRLDDSHADLNDREDIEKVVKAALLQGTQFEGQPDLMAHPCHGIHMTGWFDARGKTIVNVNPKRRSEVVYVELYMDGSADGDIPSAVNFLERIGFDANYPGDLNPETGHCWGFSTSIHD